MDQVHLAVGEIVGLVVRATRQTDLLCQVLLCLLVLRLEFDEVDTLFKSRAIIKQTDRQKEEAQAVDASNDAIESREPGRVIDYI